MNLPPDPKLFPQKKRRPKCINLSDHHFFELLEWNPQAIKNAAILWKDRPNLTLVQLYQKVVEQKVSMTQGNAPHEITLKVQLKEL